MTAAAGYGNFLDNLMDVFFEYDMVPEAIIHDLPSEQKILGMVRIIMPHEIQELRSAAIIIMSYFYQREIRKRYSTIAAKYGKKLISLYPAPGKEHEHAGQISRTCNKRENNEKKDHTLHSCPTG